MLKKILIVIFIGMLSHGCKEDNSFYSKTSDSVDSDKKDGGGLLPVPPGDGDDEKPPGDGDDEKPPGDGDDEKPPGDGDDEKPPGDGDDEKPPGDGDDEKPPGDGDDEKPPGDGDDEKPPGDGDDEKPPGDGGGDNGSCPVKVDSAKYKSGSVKWQSISCDNHKVAICHKKKKSCSNNKNESYELIFIDQNAIASHLNHAGGGDFLLDCKKINTAHKIILRKSLEELCSCKK